MVDTPAMDAAADRERELIRQAREESWSLEDAWAYAPPSAVAIPGYEILGEIGRGGMGVVYRCVQKSTKRVVAVKVLLAGAFASRAAQHRFQREVELAARFRHPGIVHVLESGLTAGGQRYYAMDYVDGVELGHWRAEARPDRPALLHVFIKICRAVEHAHAHGVIHRDLKPGNILVDRAGEPYVLDFGLSKAPGGAPVDEDGATLVSIPGRVFGTLSYLSPEQAAGALDDIDQRTDVHALGVLLYELLTGANPFAAPADPAEGLRRIREDVPRRPSSVSPHVGRDLEAIILKALEKERAHRYGSVAELRADVERHLRGEPVAARPPSRLYRLHRRARRHRPAVAVAALAVLSGAVAGGWWLWREHCRVERGRHEALAIRCRLAGGDLEMSVAEARVATTVHPDVLECGLVWAQARFLSARRSKDERMSATALHTLEAMLLKGPTEWSARMLLAEMHTINGDANAEQVRVAAEREAPDTADGWYLRAFATLDRQRAIECAERSVARCPDHPLAGHLLAYLYLHGGQFEQAHRLVRDLSARGGNPHTWMRFEVHVLTLERRFDAALALCGQVVDRFGPDRAVCRQRGLVLLCLGRYEEAVEEYRRAAALQPSGPHRDYWELFACATPLWILGRHEEAAECYRHVHERRGQVTYADARRVLVLREAAAQAARNGRPAEAAAAEEAAGQALAAAQRGVVAGSWLATIIAAVAGELTPDELVAQVDTSNPEHVCEAYYYAGETCLQRGERDAARRWFQRCVDTDLMFDRQEFPPDPMNEYHLARWRCEQLAAPDAELPGLP